MPASAIISPRQRVTMTEHVHAFTWLDSPGAGFSFDCEEDGTYKTLTPEGADNLRKCLDGTHAVSDDGIQARTWSYNEPAQLRCSCGAVVSLDGFTNACDCGRDYNSCGSLLAPRSQWGEETGESLADILRIP